MYFFIYERAEILVASSECGFLEVFSGLDGFFYGASFVGFGGLGGGEFVDVVDCFLDDGCSFLVVVGVGALLELGELLF